MIRKIELRTIVLNDKKIKLATPLLSNREFELITEVLKSGYWTEGQKANLFEEEIAKYVGTKHAVLATNCTTALELCLRIGNIGPGDKVLVPDFTYPATALVVETVGAIPVLVDVDLKTRCSSADGIESGIEEKPKAVFLVSLFGHAVSRKDMQRIQDLKTDNDFLLIEDAAGSMGVEVDGQMVGTQTDLACFSFHPRKIITTGEGGAIVTDNVGFVKKLREYKFFGMNDHHEFVSPGTNCKMSDILAAVGLAQLASIENIITTRREKAHVYDDLLDSEDLLTIPPKDHNVRNTYQSYSILLNQKINRDKVILKMAKHGIETQIGTYALSKLPHFKNIKRVENLKNSHTLYSSLLSLPMHHKLSNDDQIYITNKLKESLDDIE